tara:strand:- start:853 stop:1113 length:261 start_codon:yes stop_codon:yes gene_type:complete
METAMIPWTVMYAWIDPTSGASGIAVGEVSAPHGPVAAAPYARDKFGAAVVAMIPGCHMNKTYLFDQCDGTPVLHIDGEDRKRSSL